MVVQPQRRPVLVDSPAAFPIPDTNWQVLTASTNTPYGLAVDPAHPYIWQTSNGTSNVFRWNLNETSVTNASGKVILHQHGFSTCQGLTVDNNGHVWVAHSTGANTVGHLDTNGVWLGNVLLQLSGLRAEYFANTNLAGVQAPVRADGPVNFDWVPVRRTPPFPPITFPPNGQARCGVEPTTIANFSSARMRARRSA
jgi:hypothetical protein